MLKNMVIVSGFLYNPVRFGGVFCQLGIFLMNKATHSMLHLKIVQANIVQNNIIQIYRSKIVARQGLIFHSLKKSSKQSATSTTQLSSCLCAMQCTCFLFLGDYYQVFLLGGIILCRTKFDSNCIASFNFMLLYESYFFHLFNIRWIIKIRRTYIKIFYH